MLARAREGKSSRTKCTKCRQQPYWRTPKKDTHCHSSRFCLFHIHSRRAINSPKRHPPILSPACNLSGLGEKPVASVVWRSGGVLHADPHLPACVGVAPLGLELGLVFNHSPGSIQARWETLSVQQDSCLWWRVRVTDTAPNAPNTHVWDSISGPPDHNVGD